MTESCKVQELEAEIAELKERVSSMIDPTTRMIPIYVLWLRSKTNDCSIQGLFFQGICKAKALEHHIHRQYGKGLEFRIDKAYLNHLGAPGPWADILDWQAYRGIDFELDNRLKAELEHVATFLMLWMAASAGVEPAGKRPDPAATFAQREGAGSK